jgi:Flp pilus assembly protein TadD
LVLFLLDAVIVGRRARASIARIWPYALLSVAAAVVESAARAAGRSEAPWLFRLQSAFAAPFVYLWRTVAPVTLTPLDALPLDPVTNIGVLLAAGIALVAITVAAWKWREQWPATAAAWAAYIALLVPAAGLLPSGLQLTADRYAYLPGVVIAMAMAGAVTQWSVRLAAARVKLVAVGLAVVAIASALGTRAALAPWSDSVTLWTRVVSLDPRHDVGLYNLATALDAAGRRDEAAERYRELLAMQPAHSLARANLDRLDAARLEHEGNELAAKGDLAGAAERYRRAIALDAQRTHAHASRGMALATLGRSTEAIAELREAVRQGANDAEVFNALGVLLLQSGQTREARDVLRRGLAIRPEDLNLAHNLARLLTTGADDQADAALSLKLASAVVEATGGRDPRALDTLAAALAINGRPDEAAAASARAATAAEAQGDRELAAEIRARGRKYGR